MKIESVKLCLPNFWREQMLDIRIEDRGKVFFSGRFDASQVSKANAVMEPIDQSIIIDFNDLEYISSAGLGVLLATLKRLNDIGKTMALTNLNDHIKDIFRYSGLDQLIKIE